MKILDFLKKCYTLFNINWTKRFKSFSSKTSASPIIAFVMELVDILVLGTSAARRAGSNPAEGKHVY
jgi:hypothetical protein